MLRTTLVKLVHKAIEDEKYIERRLEKGLSLAREDADARFIDRHRASLPAKGVPSITALVYCGGVARARGCIGAAAGLDRTTSAC